MLLISPGEKVGPVLLLDCLREIHEEAREARAKEIEERKKYNAPLDDSTDWSLVDGVRDELQAALAVKDAASVSRHAATMMAMTSGNKLEPIGDFEADPDLEGVAVEFVVMSDADRRMCLAQVADGWRAIRDAHIRGASQVEMRTLDEAVVQAQERMVGLGVARVLGLDGGPVLDVPAATPAIRRGGLLGPLYLATSHMQGLSAKKALRFGQPAPSTSPSSIAAAAPSIVVDSSVAMVAGSGSRAQSTRTIVAQGGTSSTTQI